LSMIFSENRFTLFRIMLYRSTLSRSCTIELEVVMTLVLAE